MIFMSQSGIIDAAREDGWDRWYVDHLNIMASVPGTASPKPGQAVKNLAAILVVQPVAFSFDDQARVLLEVPVRGKGHPVGLEIEFTGNLLWRKIG